MAMAMALELVSRELAADVLTVENER